MMDLIDFDNNVDDGVGGECRDTEMWTSKWTLLLNNGSFQYIFHRNCTKDTFYIQIVRKKGVLLIMDEVDTSACLLSKEWIFVILR